MLNIKRRTVRFCESCLFLGLFLLPAAVANAQYAPSCVIELPEFNYISAIAASPDDRMLFVAGTYRVPGVYPETSTGYLYSLDTNKRLELVIHHDDLITAAAFSPDGKKLAAAGRPVVTNVWDLGTGDLLNTFYTKAKPEKPYQGIMRFLAFYPNGDKIVVGDEASNIHAWNLISGEEIYYFRLGVFLNCIVTLNEKRLILDSTVVDLLDSGGSITPKVAYTLGPVTVALSEDERQIAAIRENQIEYYDFESGTQLKVEEYTTLQVGNPYAFSLRKGLVLFPSLADNSYLQPAAVRLSTKSMVGVLSPAGAKMTADPSIVEFSPSGNKIILVKDNYVQIYDVNSFVSSARNAFQLGN